MANPAYRLPDVVPLDLIRIKAKLGRELAEFLRTDMRKTTIELVPKLRFTQFVQPRNLGRRRLRRKADLGRYSRKPRALFVGSHPRGGLLADFTGETLLTLAANIFRVVA